MLEIYAVDVGSERKSEEMDGYSENGFAVAGKGSGRPIARDRIAYRYGDHVPETQTLRSRLPNLTLRCKNVNKHILMMVKGATKPYREDLFTFAKLPTVLVTVENQPSPPETRLPAKHRLVFVHEQLPVQDMLVGQLS